MMSRPSSKHLTNKREQGTTADSTVAFIAAELVTSLFNVSLRLSIHLLKLLKLATYTILAQLRIYTLTPLDILRLAVADYTGIP